MSETLRPLPIGLLLLSATIYGLVFPLNRLAGDAGASHFGHAFWQTLIGGLALYLLASLKGDRVPFRWTYLRAYLVVGATGFGLPLALITMVSPHLPTALVSLAFALAPATTYLFSVLCRLERFSTFGLLGIALGFAGVLIVLAPEQGESGPSYDIVWFLLTLIIPALFAITNLSAVLLRPPGASSVAMGAGYLLGAALSISPLMLVTGQSYLPTSPTLLWVTFAVAGVLAAQIILFAVIINRYGPTFFSQFNYFVVLSAIGWGWIFFNEAAGLATWLALALMALGVLIAGLRDRGGKEQSG